MNTDNELTDTNDMTFPDNDVKYDVTVQYLRQHRFSLPDNTTLQLLKGAGEAEINKAWKSASVGEMFGGEASEKRAVRRIYG